MIPQARMIQFYFTVRKTFAKLIVAHPDLFQPLAGKCFIL